MKETNAVERNGVCLTNIPATTPPDPNPAAPSAGTARIAGAATRTPVEQ